MHYVPRLGLDPKAEQALVADMLAGSSEALEQLVEAHMPLARVAIRRYRRRAGRDEDLWAEARLALIVAARRFEPAHQVRFATYAAFWVKAYVRRYAFLDALPVRLPSSRRARRLLGELPRTRRQLMQLHGCEPDADELARELGVDSDEVARIQELLRGRSQPAAELACDAASPEEAVLEAAHRAYLEESVCRALAELPDRDRDLIRRRWLADDAPTLESVGRDLGISRQRAQQLEQRAKARLREALAALA
jgi:RNA polymerase sigma-32 factor